RRGRRRPGRAAPRHGLLDSARARPRRRRPCGDPGRAARRQRPSVRAAARPGPGRGAGRRRDRARRNPTAEERARAEARRALREHRERRAGATAAPPERPPPPRERPALWLPFADVRLTGPPRWVWRGRVPVGAVSLLAGRPKLGKSLLSIWVAAQL